MQYIGFKMNDSEYTVPIAKVQEIINLPEITKLPQSPPYMEGITNMRGKIIPIVNLKSLIGLAAGKPSLKVVVLASGRISFGILVDEITGVIAINPSDIEPSENFMKETKEQVDGVAKLGDRLLIMLDPKKVIPVADMHLFEDEVVEVIETAGDKVEVVKKVEGIGGDIFIREIMDAKEFLKNRGMDSKDPRFAAIDDILCFMDAVTAHDFEKSNECVEKIMSKGQAGLFKELGKLTRKIHDAMKGFKESHAGKLKVMAAKDVPQALDNLQLVIKGTEDAANRTLEIVEKYFAVTGGFKKKPPAFKDKQDAMNYINEFMKGFEKDLTELLTIQEFQDLTGRTLKDVIALVEETEKEMVRLIGTFGLKLEQVDKETAVSEKISQAGVDSLLRELGF